MDLLALTGAFASSVTISPASAAVAAPATATTKTTTTATSRTLFARPGNIDVERAPTQVLAVQTVDCFLRFFGRTHRDKGKTARPTGRSIGDKVCFDHGSVRREGILQVVFGDFEVKIPDEQLGAHILFHCYPGQVSALATMFPLVGFQILIKPGLPEDFHVMEVKNPSRDGLSVTAF